MSSLPTKLGNTPSVMIQGTGSDVGKSLLVSGLARALAIRGLNVYPFKPQNMSNNAAICEGGEIGRAQALQARAAGVLPISDMNPILLKPQSEIGSQVIVRGRVLCNAQAREYHSLKPTLLPHVLDSFYSISSKADIVLVEGAGSTAEVNLREGDLANMGFAEAADLPVVLVGDIERGGVIASLVGTFELLSDSERKRIKGLIVNKFRGDTSLFDDAKTILENRIKAPLLGVVPWLSEAAILPEEDSSSIDKKNKEYNKPPNKNNLDPLHVMVVRLSRISNFDDIDPLIAEPDVKVSFLQPGQVIPTNIDALIIPGSKATRADLKDLRLEGWDTDIIAFARRGGIILGLCGGFQILGKIINDEIGVEGTPGTEEGLGLLNVSTRITEEKTLLEVSGKHIQTNTEIQGYEMHMGQTDGPDLERPLCKLSTGKIDGAISLSGNISGTYIHGIFQNDSFRHAWLASLREEERANNILINWNNELEEALNGLAKKIEGSIDIDRIIEIAHAR
tara:strand:+ start:83645 stop:85168 length:1524 start_codon:yes stop_codon:yes gene_type:complete